jgi:hypothetical protein
MKREYSLSKGKGKIAYRLTAVSRGEKKKEEN